MEALEAKYGLPPEVRFCTRCVISNQRPNSAVEFQHTTATKKETIHFDAEGVCDACRFTEKKMKMIDWASREGELANRFRSPHLWKKNERGEWDLRHIVN